MAYCCGQARVPPVTMCQKVKRIYNAIPGIPARWIAGDRYAADLPWRSDQFPVSAGLDKRYRVIAKLGRRTDTSDADGQVVEKRR